MKKKKIKIREDKENRNKDNIFKIKIDKILIKGRKSLCRETDLVRFREKYS